MPGGAWPRPSRRIGRRPPVRRGRTWHQTGQSGYRPAADRGTGRRAREVAACRDGAGRRPSHDEVFAALHLTPYSEVKVLILGQVPHWTKVGKLPVACAIEAKRRGADWRACGIPAETASRDLAVSNDAIRRVARDADVSAILGTDLTCDATECYAMMDGVFLYRNPGHLNRFGSETLAKYVRLPPIAGDNTTAQARITAPRFAPASATGN